MEAEQNVREAQEDDRITQNNLLPYRVHLKVDQLPTSEGDDYLPLVHSTADNSFFTRSFPLVHTLVCSDVTDTIWVNLYGGGSERTTEVRWREKTKY